MSVLTQEILKEVLNYDSETGIFTWNETRSSRAVKGNVAGGKDSLGYIIIKIFGKPYKAHRLAWLYEKGYFPEYGLDHKDRIPYHNWILNLRERSQQCNTRNTGNFKSNKSGVKGVYFFKPSRKWRGEITLNGKKKYLGQYTHFHNAVCARLAGEQCLNWSGCDSSSPAFKYVNNGFKKELKKCQQK